MIPDPQPGNNNSSLQVTCGLQYSSVAVCQNSTNKQTNLAAGVCMPHGHLQKHYVSIPELSLHLGLRTEGYKRDHSTFISEYSFTDTHVLNHAETVVQNHKDRKCRSS